MEIFSEYTQIIILGICLCVGYIIKNLVGSKNIDRFIPLIMGIIGIVLSLWMGGFVLSPDTLLSGLISGLASTGMHQAFKQFIEKGE